MDTETHMIAQAVQFEGVFPLTVTVGKEKLKDGKDNPDCVRVTFDSLPDAAIIHAMKRGLQEDLNNARSSGGAETPESERKANILRVADKYRAADFTATRGERGPTDSVEVMAAKIGREDFARILDALLESKDPDVAAAAKATKSDKAARAKALSAYMETEKDRLHKEAAAAIERSKKQAESLTAKTGADILASLQIGLPKTES